MAGAYEDRPGPHQGLPAGLPPGGPGSRRPRREREVLASRGKVPIGRRIATIGAGALFGLLLFPLVYPVVNRLDTTSGEGANTTLAGAADGAGPTDSNPTTTSLVALQPPAAGPFVLASLEEGALSLQGRVATQELLTELSTAATATYGERVTNTATVDGAAVADWLAATPDVLSLLARATKGSMLVAEGQVQLSVQVPTEAVADRMRSDIEAATGLPVTVEGREVTNLESPELLVSGQRALISLSGKVPTQEIWDAVNAAATAEYGQFGVTNQLVVDEKVHTALWMYNPASLFEALHVFPELDIQIRGETVTGKFRGGYAFARGDATAQPESDAVTGFIVDLMARDPSLQMFVTAHTDADGDEADNLTLSEERAAYVYDLFKGAGVDEERMEAAGKGETEPVDPADTDEAKARNRRIEVQLTTMGGT